jgi:hypothetical protein
MRSDWSIPFFEPMQSNSPRHETVRSPANSKTADAAKRWEDRPGWASCFPPRNPKTDHPPDFTGVTVIDGKKFWINVYKRLDKNQARYVSVNVKPFNQEGG